MTLKIYRPERFDVLPAAVLVDIDNTIYPYEPAHNAAMKSVFQRVSSLFGTASDSEVKGAFDQARHEVKGRVGNTAASHSRLLYFHRMIELMGMKTQIVAALDLEQVYWRNFLKHSELFSGCRDFLLELRSVGIGLAAVTDMTSQIQFRKLVYFGIDESFDFVITSEEAGIEKPDRRIFQLALDKLGCSADRVWMIGDDLRRDIEGAKALGMVTLQKTHIGVMAGKGEQKADAAFEEFEVLTETLLRGSPD
ncbi:putative hydrolase of the HAD superfamily [Azospirillaceae bacterium]